MRSTDRSLGVRCVRALLPLGVSGAILFALYRGIDLGSLGTILAGSDVVLMSVAVGLTAVTVALSVARLRSLAAPFADIGWREGTGQILSACSLNLVLPSKLGDLAKAIFIRRRSGIAGETAFALVALEKGADLLALCLFGAGALLFGGTELPGAWAWGSGLLVASVIGIFLVAHRGGAEAILSRLGERGRTLARGFGAVRTAVLEDPRAATTLASQSLVLWFLHLFQIWVFIQALGAEVPLGAHLGLGPLALLAGLLPFTFAGVGTRDGAILVLYGTLLSPAQGVAVGLFCTIRYFLPAIAGIPALWPRLVSAKKGGPGTGHPADQPT